jgi:hypothetical protein
MHGSADPDPDPYQNVMDPQHWFLVMGPRPRYTPSSRSSTVAKSPKLRAEPTPPTPIHLHRLNWACPSGCFFSVICHASPILPVTYFFVQTNFYVIFKMKICTVNGEKHF